MPPACLGGDRSATAAAAGAPEASRPLNAPRSALEQTPVIHETREFASGFCCRIVFAQNRFPLLRTML
jgi:hypothetical protein